MVYLTVIQKSAVSFSAKVLAFLIGMVSVQPRISDAASHPRISPSVSILLPQTVPSETVQIAYFLVGPFGGYQTSTEPKAGLHSYEIDATVEGKGANQIKMIVYASGCEFRTFDLNLVDDSRPQVEFECERVHSVRLSGQIFARKLLENKDTELVIFYRAFWAHTFFGIADGMITEFRLATITPKADGAFQIELPYLGENEKSSSAETAADLHLMLTEPETGKVIAYNLLPGIGDYGSKDRGLQIRPDYPKELEFSQPDAP